MAMAVPKDLEKLPVEKILEFRGRYPEERGKFQKLVNDFVRSREWLKDIKDQAALEERLRSEYDKTLKPRLEELRQKMHDVKIDTVYGCFSVKALLPPIATTTLASMGAVLNRVVAAAAGFVWMAFGVIRDKRKGAQKELRSSEVAYLFRAERELKPQTLAGWVRQGISRFCFGV